MREPFFCASNMKDDIYFDYHMGEDPPKTKTKERLWTVVIACLAAALGNFSVGYCIGYSSAAVVQLNNVNTTDVYLNKKETQWFVSIMNIGGMIGGPLGGWIMDFLGRKIGLMITAVPFSAGWLMIGFGKNAGLLTAGRFFTGLGLGMSTNLVPNYISETAPSRLRGTLGNLTQLAMVVGILMSFVVGYAFGDFRWSSIVGIIPSGCLVILMTFMPETARWLLAHGKEERAERTLLWLRGPDVKIHDEIVEIKQSLDVKEKMSIKEFAKPSLLRPLFISMTIHFFQQSTGINVVMFYCAKIFETAGFKEDSTMVPILIGLIQLLASAISFFLIDRGGRRFLLIIGGVGMCISCFTLGAYYFVSINPASNSAYKGPDIAWVAVTSVSVYIVGFVIAWGPITWLLMSEVFPVKARGTASGIASAFNWFCSFIMTLTFEIFIDALKASGTFWLYGGLAFVAVVFVFVFVPETKGKSLEEIQQYFEGKGKRERNSGPERESDV